MDEWTAPQRVAFGARLKSARNAKSLTLADVGAMFGTSKQTIGHWETGQNMPSAEQVARVADEYGESVEWLLFGRRATSFTAELQARLALVDDDALRRLENGLRSHFDMEPLAKQAPAKRRQAA